MTAAELNTLINTKAKTTDTDFPQAEKLVMVNLFKDEIAGKIQKERNEAWNIPSTFDLVSDQREYAFPETVMNNIVSLSLKFSSSGDFVKAKYLQRHHYDEPLQETKIVNDFNNEIPAYFVRRKAIYILSGTIVAVTGGGALVYDAFPADLANLTDNTDDISKDPTTTTLGFPKEFHELLGRRVSMEYKDNNGISFSALENKYEDDLDKKIAEYSIPSTEKETIGALPSGESRGDNGFEY